MFNVNDIVIIKSNLIGSEYVNRCQGRIESVHTDSEGSFYKIYMINGFMKGALLFFEEEELFLFKRKIKNKQHPLTSIFQ